MCCLDWVVNTGFYNVFEILSVLSKMGFIVLLKFRIFLGSSSGQNYLGVKEIWTVVREGRTKSRCQTTVLTAIIPTSSDLIKNPNWYETINPIWKGTDLMLRDFYAILWILFLFQCEDDNDCCSKNCRRKAFFNHVCLWD